MGAWGYGPFENDDAADFVYAFEEEGESAVTSALAAVVGNTAYIDAADASIAVAAAAMVAATVGRDKWLSESAREALSARTAELVGLKGNARAAIDRILLPQSELLELWEEAEPDDLAGFRRTLAELRSDLS